MFTAEREDQLSAVGFAQRLDGKRSEGAQAPAPAWPFLQETGTRLGEQQERHLLDSSRDILDQVKQGVIRPMNVFKHQTQRFALTQRLNKSPQRGMQHALVVRFIDAIRGQVQPSEQREV